MKKIAITLIMAIYFNVTIAQDTVRYPDHWYGYTPREALMEYVCPEQTNLPGSLAESWYTVNYGMYLYKSCNQYDGMTAERRVGLMRAVNTDANQKLYGIAVTMNPDVFDTLSGKLLVYRGVYMLPKPSAVIPGAIQPYMYDCYVDSIIAIPLNNPPLMKECVFEYDYSLPSVWSLYSNCYEFYFDEPVDLSLTYNTYIGITDCGFYLDKLNLGRDTSRSQEWYRAYEGFGGLNPEAPIGFQNFMYKGLVFGEGKYEEYYTQPGYENKYWYDCYWGMIFPILSPRCTAPKCLHIASGGEMQDTARWCGDAESEVFQVSLVGYPAPAESGVIATVTDTSFLLPRELPDTVCVAYVRKMCTFDFATHTDTVWGDWAGPIVVAGDTTGLGIDTTGSSIDTTGTGGDSLSIATADLQHIFLTPNPATGTVTVRSTERMTEIEVLDIVGSQVLWQKASGLAAKLDVTAFPRGSYIVRIHTPMGVTSRKLILQ